MITETRMIKLTLADGGNVHINPTAIAYVQALPGNEEEKGNKERPKAEVGLVSGKTFTVRQPTPYILAAGGFAHKGGGGKKKLSEAAPEAEAATS